MSLWEQILMGGVAVLVVLWFRPGIRAAFERSRQAQERDWAGVLIPIAVVVVFVLLLIVLVRA
jgi:hypothetical protein